ncbi:MAG: hypothetical protein AAF216_02765 [Pseudomonadota bacterium]
MDFVRSLVSWILALALIFLFLQATVHPLPGPPPGQVKLFDLPGENIVFQTIAERSGLAIWEPAGRVGVAIAELFTALMLLFPLTRRFGAVLSFGVLSGAVGLHLSPWLGMEVPLSLEAGAATDGGQLFMLAVAMLVVSLLVIVIHPGKRSRVF